MRDYVIIKYVSSFVILIIIKLLVDCMLGKLKKGLINNINI